MNPEAKIPPHNLEAEMSVLGGMVMDRDAATEVLPILIDRDFYQPRHQVIYNAIHALHEKNLALDYITLVEELTRRNQLESAGGKEYVIEVIESASSSAHAVDHARIVKAKSLLRRLIQQCQHICEEAHGNTGDVQEFLDGAEQRVFEIAGSTGSGEPRKIDSILQEAFYNIDFRDRKGRHPGIESGYFELDDMTGGFNGGDLVIIAGRPSMGKTAFALNIVEHVAVHGKKPVAVFSLEMSSQQVVQRMLCARARVSAHNLRDGKLRNEEYSELSAAAGDLSKAAIFVDDSPGMTALQVRANARRLKARKDIGLVVVDYLQLMDSPRAESRQQEISTISRSLKALARDLNIPVIALSQLNRAADSRDDRRPKLADLRESGAIEQDADVVMMLYREEYYYPDREQVKGIAEIEIAKQRNGPTGRVKLSFRREIMRFENLTSSVGTNF